MATASVSCASGDSAPRLIPPVEKRLTISPAGSTSSSGIGSTSWRSSSSPRSIPWRAFSSLTRWEKRS